MNGQKSAAELVKKAYLKLLPVQILGMVITAVNSFIDSIIVGRFLGTEAMAAIGFYGPVSNVIWVVNILIIGIQILCGQYIGSGEGKKVVSLFSTGVVFIGGAAALFSAGCLLFRYPLAAFLGARGDTVQLLADYIAGCSIGIVGQLLTALLSGFLPLNNEVKRSYLGIAVTTVVNITLDILFVTVIPLGVLGTGLATSLSYLLTMVIVFAAFIPSDRAVYFRFGNFCFGTLLRAAYLGLPSLLFTLGCTAKSLIMNQTMMTLIGHEAVAVMNVQNSLVCILGAIPQGAANSFLTLGSIYYGEKDRSSLLAAMRYGLKLGVALSVAAMAALMVSAPVLPSIFFDRSDSAWEICRQMLLIFPSFLAFNTIYNLLTKGYQCQGKMTFLNGMTVAEQVLTALLAVAGARALGVNGVWIAFPLGQIVCIAIIGISVFLFAGKITFSLPDWLKLDSKFGASEDECLEFSVASMEDVVNISRKITAFCEGKGLDDRSGMVAGLCVEEMAGNVVLHGFQPGEKHSLDIRIVIQEYLTIRIRDDCRAFDPRKRLDQFHPEDPAKNVGIRMIARLAKEMNYQNSVGINTVLINVGSTTQPRKH